MSDRSPDKVAIRADLSQAGRKTSDTIKAANAVIERVREQQKASSTVQASSNHKSPTTNSSE